MYVNAGEIIVLISKEFSKMTNLFVCDPFRIGLNAAANLTRFDDIKKLFSKSFEILINSVQKYEKGEQIEKQILKLLYPIKEEKNEKK